MSTLLKRWDAVGAVLAEVRPDEIRQAIVDAERLRTENADLQRSIADLSHPNCKMLLADCDRLRAELAECQMRNVALMIPKLAVSGEDERNIDEINQLRAENADLRRKLADALNPTWPNEATDHIGSS